MKTDGTVEATDCHAITNQEPSRWEAIPGDDNYKKERGAANIWGTIQDQNGYHVARIWSDIRDGNDAATQNAAKIAAAPEMANLLADYARQSRTVASPTPRSLIARTRAVLDKAGVDWRK